MGLLAFGLGAVYHNALTLTGYVYHMEDWQMQDLKEIGLKNSLKLQLKILFQTLLK